MNSILHRTANRSLPTSSPLAALPQLFPTYLSDKISKLHFNLQTNPCSTAAHSLPPSPPYQLHFFTPATLHENRPLTLSIFWFLLWSRFCFYHRTKENFQRNMSNYLSIVNLSITTGTLPSTLKSSIISSLLKNIHSIRKICLITALLQTSSSSPN